MKSSKLLEFLKQKSITVPLFFYREKGKLGLDTDTFFFLMYLMSLTEPVKMNPEIMMKDLNCTLPDVMNYISILTEKGYINLEVAKNDANIMEEHILLDGIYNKVLKNIIEDINDNKEEEKQISIYDKIQQEFGRILSPMEYEIIGAWIDGAMSEELITEALKEAVYNGVNNLRYIDKILYEWGKKGYKTKEDVEKGRMKRKQEQEKAPKPKKEIFDYNWLEDEDNE